MSDKLLFNKNSSTVVVEYERLSSTLVERRLDKCLIVNTCCRVGRAGCSGKGFAAGSKAVARSVNCCSR